MKGPAHTLSAADRKRLFAAMLDAMAERGRPVQAIRISPDGTVTLLTESPAGALAANDDADWISLAGQTDLPRA